MVTAIGYGHWKVGKKVGEGGRLVKGGSVSVSGGSSLALVPDGQEWSFWVLDALTKRGQMQGTSEEGG